MGKIKVLTVILSILSITRILAQVDFQSSNLPIVIINTNGVEIPDDPKIIGSLNIINKSTGLPNKITDTPNEFNLNVAIELRGQPDEWTLNKASYSMELKDNLEKDTAVSLFGMGKEEDWIIHGPYADKSLIRNYLTFHLWKKTNNYGSDVQLCEVIINNDYKGVFVFMESIKRDDDRVDISKLNTDENTGDDLTGGYIFKIDKASNSVDVKSWTSPIAPLNAQDDSQVITFRMEYPKPEDITTTQFNYISGFVTDFEQALASEDFTSAENGYSNYIEALSFIDYALLTEISRNVNGFRKDAYLYKDKDSKGGKLVMGPPWEFNFAFGNTDYCDGGLVEGWVMDFNETCEKKDELNPFWWKRLMDDPGFALSFKTRWQTLRNGPFQTSKILFTIDSLATVLDAPQQRNFQKWPILDTYIYPNNYVGTTYQDEIDYLKTWITERMAWMDTAIDLMDIVLETSQKDQHIFSIYPNPASDFINIKTQNEISSYQIFDQSGRVVIASNMMNNHTALVDLTFIPKGLYFLTIKFADGTSLQKHFIKI